MSINYAVLVVEPEAELRETIARQLVRRGYAVTAVNHPRQALAVATFKDFGAAVIGGDLPEIDSVTLVTRLQRLINELRPIVLSQEGSLSVANCARVVERSLPGPALELAILAAIHAPRVTPTDALAVQGA